MDDEVTDDELLADLIADMAMDVLESIGTDAEIRYQFFREFTDLATRTVRRHSRNVQ